MRNILEGVWTIFNIANTPVVESGVADEISTDSCVYEANWIGELKQQANLVSCVRLWTPADFPIEFSLLVPL